MPYGNPREEPRPTAGERLVKTILGTRLERSVRAIARSSSDIALARDPSRGAGSLLLPRLRLPEGSN